MRRRKASDSVAALREEAHGLVAITFYAAALDAESERARCHGRLVEVARRLRVEKPPPWRELVERPARIDEWAADVGLSPVWLVSGG